MKVSCLSILLALMVSLSLPVQAADLRPVETSMPSPENRDTVLMINKTPFDLAALMAFPAYEADIQTNWNATGSFRGALLTDVLHAAGIKDFERLSLIAGNDYRVTMSKGTPGFDTALLAYALDGNLLDPLDKGPVWLVWPSQAEELLSGEDSADLWVWSLAIMRKMR